MLLRSAFRTVILALNEERRQADAAQSADSAKSLPPKPSTAEDRGNVKDSLPAKEDSLETTGQI